MNGMNGGGMLGPPGGGPTPAGHQMELNKIYAMVDELSRQLTENRRVTEDIVVGLGRVRNRARAQGLSNEELINATSDELNGRSANLDAHISILTEALEKAKFGRDANAELLERYVACMRDMLRQFHEYKAKHVHDVSVWHNSYRVQLAEARSENCRLREQMWEMQARAGKANEALRQFRSRYEEDEERWQRRADSVAMRQEIRFWKRMAMPHIPEDDPYWSDDDDLIDVQENLRLQEIERKIREQADITSQGDGVDQQQQHEAHGIAFAPAPPRQAPLAGGIFSTQVDAGDVAPTPPPRPSSAASTGSSGQ